MSRFGEGGEEKVGVQQAPFELRQKLGRGLAVGRRRVFPVVERKGRGSLLTWYDCVFSSMVRVAVTENEEWKSVIVTLWRKNPLLR